MSDDIALAGGEEMNYGSGATGERVRNGIGVSRLLREALERYLDRPAR